MIRLMEDGILMVNHTVKMKIQTLDGSDLECWEEEQIIGEEFP